MNQYETRFQKVLADIKKGKRTSPLVAIRMDCLECMGFQVVEVTNCELTHCILHAYRMGKNTSGKRLSSGPRKPFIRQEGTIPSRSDDLKAKNDK